MLEKKYNEAGERLWFGMIREKVLAWATRIPAGIGGIIIMGMVAYVGFSFRQTMHTIEKNSTQSVVLLQQLTRLQAQTESTNKRVDSMEVSINQRLDMTDHKIDGVRSETVKSVDELRAEILRLYRDRGHSGS